MATIKKFHWFWAWEDEKEEAWLREMSQQGQHFRSVTVPGIYSFELGAPADYVYRLDYFVDRKDMPNYLQLFQDAGWEYMGEMGAWQYFRNQAVNGEAQEIYSDNESKAKKYRRLLLFLVIFLPIYVNFFPMLVRRLSQSTESIFQALTFLLFAFVSAIMLVYVYAMIRLLQRIVQLQRKV